MPVSMLMTNTESVNPWATAPVRPRATTIETMARSSGSPAATSAPKTSTRMISAAGRPILSSPDLRSLWESSLRSRATVHSPVIDTLKPFRPSAASTASARSSTPPSDSSRS